MKNENNIVGETSKCVQCAGLIQFDGRVWLHTNGAVRHTAIPPKTVARLKTTQEILDWIEFRLEHLRSRLGEDNTSVRIIELEAMRDFITGKK